MNRSLPLVLLVLLAACMGVLLGTGLVSELGHRIPQRDLESDYAQGIVIAILLGGSIFLWPVPRSDKRALGIIWIAKVFVTLVFMLFYENHYPLDAYAY